MYALFLYAARDLWYAVGFKRAVHHMPSRFNGRVGMLGRMGRVRTCVSFSLPE